MTNIEVIRRILKDYKLSVKQLARTVECDESELYRILSKERTGNRIMLNIFVKFPEYFKEFKPCSK